MEYWIIRQSLLKNLAISLKATLKLLKPCRKSYLISKKSKLQNKIQTLTFLRRIQMKTKRPKGRKWMTRQVRKQISLLVPHQKLINKAINWKSMLYISATITKNTSKWLNLTPSLQVNTPGLMKKIIFFFPSDSILKPITIKCCAFIDIKTEILSWRGWSFWIYRWTLNLLSRLTISKRHQLLKKLWSFNDSTYKHIS